MTEDARQSSSCAPNGSRSNIERIVAILTAFGPQNTAIATAELVRICGASQATGYGLIRAMVQEGLIERVDHGLVRLGPRARELAFASLSGAGRRRARGRAVTTVPETDNSAVLENATTDEWHERLIRLVDCTVFRKPPPYRLAFANASLSNPWRGALLNSLLYGANINSGSIIDLQVQCADDNWERQLNQIDELVEAEPDALIISVAPGEDGRLSERLRTIAASGIPVIAVDRRGRDEDACTSFVTASDRMIGRTSAQWLTEKLNGQGRIWMLSGTQGTSPAIRRQSSALECFANAPGILVESVVHTGWTRQGGRIAIEELLRSFEVAPDAVWCDSGLQGVGSLDAFSNHGLPPPLHTGGDLNVMYKQALHARVPFVAVDYPAAMGALAIETALTILRGEKVARRIEAPVRVVLPRGQETHSIKADEWAERHVRWDLPDEAILSQGPALRRSPKSNARRVLEK